jgi:hypothetical protein
VTDAAFLSPLPLPPAAGILAAVAVWIGLGLASAAYFGKLLRIMAELRRAAYRPQDAAARRIADDTRDVLRVFVAGAALFAVAGAFSLANRLAGGLPLPPPFAANAVVIAFLIAGHAANTLAVRLWARRLVRRLADDRGAGDRERGTPLGDGC